MIAGLEPMHYRPPPAQVECWVNLALLQTPCMIQTM